MHGLDLRIGRRWWLEPVGKKFWKGVLAMWDLPAKFTKNTEIFKKWCLLQFLQLEKLFCVILQINI